MDQLILLFVIFLSLIIVLILTSAFRASNKAIIIVSFLSLGLAVINIVLLMQKTLIKGEAIYQILEFSRINIRPGILIDGHFSVIILFLLIGLSLDFFQNRKKDNNIIRISVVQTIILLIISVASDYFILISIFSVGTLISTFLFLKNYSDIVSDWQCTKDFLLQRICDAFLLASFALLYMKYDTMDAKELAEFSNDISMFPRIMLFSALSFRLLTASFISELIFTHSKFIFFCVLVIALRLQWLLFQQDILDDIFFSISFAFSLITLFLLLIFRNKQRPPGMFYYFFSNIFFVLLGNYKILSSMILCGMIAFSSLFFFRSKKKEQIKIFPIYYSIQQIPLRGIYLFGEIFSKFIGFFYTNILFFRAPQLIFGIVQLPLRFFHNGSISRSFLFVVLTLSAYVYYWTT